MKIELLFLYLCVIISAVVALSELVRPEADFSVQPASGEAPLQVEFQNNSYGRMLPITRYSWDFGDGTPTESAKEPRHTYTKAGKYTVSLTAYSLWFKKEVKKAEAVTVTARDSDVSPDFIALTRTGAAPLTVQFVDVSRSGQHRVRGVLWEFGDGTTSEVQNPIHSYDEPGLYSVSFELILDIGRFREVKRAYIKVEGNQTEGEGEAEAEGEGEEIIEGEGEEIVEGEGEAEAEGEGEEIVEGEGEEITEGEGEEIVEGEGEEIIEGEGEEITEGEGEEIAEGEGEEITEGEGEEIVEGEGEEIIEGEGEDVPVEPQSPTLRMKHTVDTDYQYEAGAEIVFTVTLEFEGEIELSSLVVQEQLPGSWVFQGIVDDGGLAASSDIGSEDLLEFSWSSPFTFPLTFSYRLKAPDEEAIVLFPPIAVYEAEGELLSSNEVETQLRSYQTIFVLDREVGAYTPGEIIEITVFFEAFGIESPLVFGLVETLPEGWSFVECVNGLGTLPDVLPDEGTEGDLEFSWFTPPAIPGSMKYKVLVPESFEGPGKLYGYGLYRFTDSMFQTAGLESLIPRTIH
ncbi:MAG: PKD domain-containing protein [Candidatus Hydrogenedentes bacterium]|nr:PKD domain-containing protein [Candidatus Hydrogenedentota bacterium]